MGVLHKVGSYLVVEDFSHTNNRCLLSVKSRVFDYPDNEEMQKYALWAAKSWCDFVNKHENPKKRQYAVVQIVHLEKENDEPL